jgi:hypothetical protein
LEHLVFAVCGKPIKKAGAILATLVTAWAFSAGAALASEKDEEPLFPVRQNKKWGYIDKTGQMVIPPRKVFFRRRTRPGNLYRSLR